MQKYCLKHQKPRLSRNLNEEEIKLSREGQAGIKGHSVVRLTEVVSGHLLAKVKLIHSTETDGI